MVFHRARRDAQSFGNSRVAEAALDQAHDSALGGGERGPRRPHRLHPLAVSARPHESEQLIDDLVDTRADPGEVILALEFDEASVRQECSQHFAERCGDQRSPLRWTTSARWLTRASSSVASRPNPLFISAPIIAGLAAARS